jgi:hypothetical protein
MPLWQPSSSGVWTPVIKGASTPGTGTYSIQSGFWSLIGDRCFIDGYLIWSAHDGTGNMVVDGLPRAANAAGLSALSMFFSLVTLANPPYAYVNAGTTQIILTTSALAAGANAAVAIDAAGTMRFSGNYRI